VLRSIAIPMVNETSRHPLDDLPPSLDLPKQQTTTIRRHPVAAEDTLNATTTEPFEVKLP
jgi:hypothetical protein